MSTTAAAVELRRARVWSASNAMLAAAAVVVGLVALELWALSVAYPLRVTADMPTYLALLRAMAAHPLSPQSPFLATQGVTSPHATPYVLALALLWHSLAPAGQAGNPVAAGRFLALIGIPVSLATLGTIALFASRIAGRRQGVVSIAILLVLFGPAHVIWANDLTLHGFLYAGFYPENVALALALATLLALRGRGRASLALACLLAGATMVEHPMTGTLLAGLVAIEGCARAWRGEPGAYRSSAALSVGFIAGMAWPTYQLNQAMAQSGIPGSVVIAACVAAPRVLTLLASPLRRYVLSRRGGVELRRRTAVLSRALTGTRTLRWLAIGGAVIVWDLALWEILLVLDPPSDPLIHVNRLAIYWGEDRWRWFLMLSSGAVGLSGLVRLAQRRQPLLLIWFLGCFGIALLGLLGAPMPVWWRFLLLCQIPLAIGTAVVLVELGHDLVRRVVIATLGFSLAFKLFTLLALPTTVSYFGAPLQPTYYLGQVIPATPGGLLASDPFTSYYIPAATGRSVLTVTKAHVGSQAELSASTRGYALLHGFYAAPDSNWWPAAQALWKSDVRYVLLEKRTSLAPPDLQTFSTGPTPLIRTPLQQHLMGRLHWRLRRIGQLVHDDKEYALYRLDGTILFPPNPDRSDGRRHP